MRNLIIEHLRLFTEGRLATHTPTNPKGDNVKKETSLADFNRTLNSIAKATKKYRDNYEDYGDIYDGDGLYQLDLYPNGQLVGKPTHMGVKQEVGFNKPNPHKMSFFVKAYTHVQHPDQPEKAGKARGISAMDDAKIKVLANFSSEITQFLKSNMAGEDEYTADDKGSEIQKQRMDMDTWGYKLDRDKREKELAANKSTISMGDEKSKLYNQIQDVVVAKIEATRNRDRERAKALAKIEKELRAKFKQL